MAPWAHKVMLELREYANTGGKLLVDGRNVHQTFTPPAPACRRTGPYTWTPDKLFGFFYPPNNEGDDDLPGTAWQRSRDDLQRHVAELPRRRRPPGRRRRDRHEVQHRARTPVAAGSLFAGMTPFTVHSGAGQRPEPERRRHAAAAGRIAAAPAQLDQRLPNEPLRPERVAGRLRHPAGADRQRRRDHLDARYRDVRLRPRAGRPGHAQRAGPALMAHLLPTRRTRRRRRSSASSTRRNLSNATPGDPVEIELTAYDERGDMDYVDL